MQAPTDDRKGDQDVHSHLPPSHVVEDQGEVFRFLADRASHGIDEDVRQIDTHGAAVFLAGKDAYKVKRAVRFPFMDFSTIEKRRAACQAEIAVNRPGAPTVYIDAVPVVRRGGTLHLGGDGEIVEWVVHMRRFDESLTLDHIAARGALSPDLVRRMAAAVAASHRRAEVRIGVDFAAALGLLIDENGASLCETPGIFGADRIAALTRRSRETLGAVSALLSARAADGQVRRCHGDLHLRNLILIDGEPTLFDAIEFNEELATIDVLYDLAFLLMDLAERDLRFEANLLLNRYLVECRDDRQLSGLAALPLLISVRAAIRAKVTAASLDFSERSQQNLLVQDARRYLAFAQTALRPSAPRLVAVGGLSGTGKSTLASLLAPDMGSLPGAVHLRSDVERKHLLKAPEFSRLPASAYDEATTDTVYAALHRKTALALKAGYSVVVDAVHQRVDERRALAQLAERHGVAFTGLWLEAPVGLLISRVGTRLGDASDADASVVAQQAEREAGEIEWHRIDASRSPAMVLRDARSAIDPDRHPGSS